MCGAGANHQYCFISAKSMLTHTALLKSGTSNKMYIQKLKVYVVKVALSVCLYLSVLNKVLHEHMVKCVICALYMEVHYVSGLVFWLL